MKDQSQSGSDNDLATRLESLSNETRGVTVDRFHALLKTMPEKMSPAELNQIINFASDQVGIWEAEYSFSPITSPHITAKAESELWAELWEAWSDMLLNLVPDVADKIHRKHRLIIARHSVEKSLHYTADKPVRRIISTTASKVAIILGRLGAGNVAEQLYAFSLYPKGSVGRGKG
jgi:hypothetical protein